MASIFIPTLVFAVAVGVCGLILLLPAPQAHSPQLRWSGGLLAGLSLVFLTAMYLAAAGATETFAELAQRIGWLLLGAASVTCAARIITAPGANGASRWFAALLVSDAALCLSIGAFYVGTVLLAGTAIGYRLLRPGTAEDESHEPTSLAGDAVMSLVGGGLLAIVLLGTIFFSLSGETSNLAANENQSEASAQQDSIAASTNGLSGLGTHLFENQAPVVIGVALMLLAGLAGTRFLVRADDSQREKDFRRAD